MSTIKWNRRQLVVALFRGERITSERSSGCPESWHHSRDHPGGERGRQYRLRQRMEHPRRRLTLLFWEQLRTDRERSRRFNSRLQHQYVC